MSDLNLTLQDNGGVYLAITETPAVVTLGQAVISGALASSVTVTNVVSVNVVTMPAINMTPAAVTTVAGTVTASVVGSRSFGSEQYALPINKQGEDSGDTAVHVGFDDYGQFKVAGYEHPFPIFGAVTANVFGENVNTGLQVALPIASGEDSFPLGSSRLGVQLLQTDGLAVGDGSGILPVSGTVTIGSLPAISGTVTASVTNSITVGSLPVQFSTTTIGGTSRLNVTLSSATTVGATAPSYGNLSGGSDGTNFRAILTDTSGRTVVTVSNFPSTQPVSLASLPALAAGTAQIGSVTASISGTVPVSGTFWQATQPVSGTVTAAVASTTVTVSAMPSGTLTTRFGTPTTANTAFLTSAVTNTARKYLLIQNVTTASNVITVGVGFVPTTTQGIQLAAGAGITFESSYIPTGAVWVLSSVTASNHTILEA